MSVDGGFPPGTLDVIRDLFRRLDDAGIRYCHWKSSASLPRALAGDTDLDLLVYRPDADRFQDVLHQLSFKPFVSHVSRRFPFVEDWLGLDPAAGKLVHLHVYYRLVIGEHYVKNHVLTIENALLQRSVIKYGIRVPRPADELVVLVVRALLQYRDTDALKDLLSLGKRGGIPRDMRAEVAALTRATSTNELTAAARTLLPSVPAEIFTTFVETLVHHRRDARTLLRLRHAVRVGLRGFERMSATAARARYLHARLVRAPIVRELLGIAGRSQARRKVPRSGGLTVAVVGADGSGKSTVVEALRDWLAWRVNLRIEYLGTARPSRRTAAFQITARWARRITSRAANDNHLLVGAVRFLTALRYLAEARDRTTRVANGERSAAAGTVVLFDRYPLALLRLNGRTMDGPRIHQITGGATNGLIARLGKLETGLYSQIPMPDLVVLLQLPAEVALSRKSSRRPADIAEKAAAVMNATNVTLPADVVTIDATRPLNEVLREVKQEIWRRL